MNTAEHNEPLEPEGQPKHSHSEYSLIPLVSNYIYCYPELSGSGQVWSQIVRLRKLNPTMYNT